MINNFPKSDIAKENIQNLNFSESETNSNISKFNFVSELLVFPYTNTSTRYNRRPDTISSYDGVWLFSFTLNSLVMKNDECRFSVLVLRFATVSETRELMVNYCRTVGLSVCLSIHLSVGTTLGCLQAIHIFTIIVLLLFFSICVSAPFPNALLEHTDSKVLLL